MPQLKVIYVPLLHYSICVFFYIFTFTSELYTFTCFCVAVWHLFISTWRTPFSMPCKAGLMVISSLSFSLSGKVSTSFLKDGFAGYSIFVQQFVFYHFKYIIPLISGLQGFCWESYKDSLVCDKLLFSCYFEILFLALLTFWLCISLWSYLVSSYLEPFGLHESDVHFLP